MLSFVWDSSYPPAEMLNSLLNTLDGEIELGQVFASTPNGGRYRIKGIICYYGAHYAAFIWQAVDKAWFVFNDSSVSQVGSLNSV